MSIKKNGVGGRCEMNSVFVDVCVCECNGIVEGV